MNDDAPKVLLVMKQPGNLRITEQVLGGEGVAACGVSDEAGLDALLGGGFLPGLALVDVSGFDAAVWRMCATLKARQFPFIVLHRPDDPGLGSRSLHYGAVSVLQKPVAKSALLQLIQGLAR